MYSSGGDRALVRQARALSTLLGDDHDLAILKRVALQETKPRGSSDVCAVFDLIARQRSSLQEKAFKIGGRLFLETRAQLLGRLNAYWRIGAWRMASQSTFGNRAAGGRG